LKVRDLRSLALQESFSRIAPPQPHDSFELKPPLPIRISSFLLPFVLVIRHARSHLLFFPTHNENPSFMIEKAPPPSDDSCPPMGRPFPFFLDAASSLYRHEDFERRSSPRACRSFASFPVLLVVPTSPLHQINLGVQILPLSVVNLRGWRYLFFSFQWTYAIPRLFFFPCLCD